MPLAHVLLFWKARVEWADLMFGESRIQKKECKNGSDQMGTF